MNLERVTADGKSIHMFRYIRTIPLSGIVLSFVIWFQNVCIIQKAPFYSLL